MTYTFDPARWYELRRAILEKRLADGELDRGAFDAEAAELDRRYEEMLSRLDGTYQIPK